MPYDHVLGFITCVENIAKGIQEANKLPDPLARNDPRVFEFERHMLNVRINRDGYLFAGCGKSEEIGNGLEEGRYYAILVVDEGRKRRLEASLGLWKTRLEDAIRSLKERDKARMEHREESISGGNQEAATHAERENEDSDEEDYKITSVDETIACYVYLGMLHGPVV
ncbi:hypothetical protein BDQ17DRAFT_1333063 [Cyathus striatus]|nr:hypothetical protein BDQ17DRAFT_1333063 [Cyathus striatus]